MKRYLSTVSLLFTILAMISPIASAVELVNGVPVNGLIASTGNDLMYSIDIPSGASNLVIKIEGGSGDADLYTRSGSEPTDSTYECRPYVNGNNETCTEPNPASGTWYVRVKAYSSFSNVSLTASYDGGGSSSGGSSSGGSSSGGSSSGGSSSGGSSSSSSGGNQLQNGVPVSGLSASTGDDVVYTINVPGGASNLVIKIEGGSGDADLYTRAASVPTDSTYECRPYINGNNETCTEPNPASGTWYARVKAYSSFSNLTLTASFDGGGSSSGGSSSGGSSSGGSSSGGSSSGGSSSGGSSSGGNELQNGVPVSGLSASIGNDIVYTIDVPGGASNLVIKIAGGSGDADLYTRAGSAPTDSTYACRPYVGGNSETCTEPNPSSGIWYARVKAYESFSNVTLTASYDGGGSSSGGSSSGGSSSGGSSGGVDPTVPVFPSCDNLNIDNDKDGIPDCAEESGKYFYGMPVYDYGARKNQIDVFMEVDYMLAHELVKYDGTIAKDENGQALIDYGSEPLREVFDKLKQVYAAHGWVMHFDVGDLYDQAPGIDPDDYDLGGGNALPFAEETYFYSYDDCDQNTGRCITTSGMDDYKENHFKNNHGRDRLFYYIVIAVSHPGSGRGNTTGVAPDLFDFSAQITVGGEYWQQTDITSTLGRNILINSQATMIAHEFGHIIGLSHGGSKADGDQNGKVNYHSVMNYMYTLLGAPSSSHSDISKNLMVYERYLSHHYVYANVNDCANIAKQTYPDYQGMYHDKGVYFDHAIIRYGMGADPQDFNIDYSDGSEPGINESSFNENNLYGGRDFNCDGSVSSGSTYYDLNRSGNQTTIVDYNDWDNIHLYYRHLNYDENGVFQTTPNYEATSATHPSDIPGLGAVSAQAGNSYSQNSLQPMSVQGIQEQPLSPAFFKNLQRIKRTHKTLEAVRKLNK